MVTWSLVYSSKALGLLHERKRKKRKAYLITVFDAQIVVLDIKVEVGENKLLLDELPDNSGHLVTIEVDDGVLNVDLASSHCSTV